MKEVNERNAVALHEAQKILEKLVRDQTKLLTGIQNGLNSAISRISELERGLSLQRASSLGHGPSVK